MVTRTQLGPALAGGVWLLLIGVTIWLQQTHGVTTTVCWWKHATGIPCPTCGCTRSLLALGQGDAIAALRANPLLPMLLLGAGLWLVCGRRATIFTSRWSWSIVAVLFVANWVWLIVDGR
jgi:Protein of unknown function (DUF2752)